MRRMLSSVSAVDADLPYNWNWQRRWKEAGGFLTQHPIVLLDVGARGSAPTEFDSMSHFVRRIGFEPDEEECRALNASGEGTFYPSIIAETRGEQTLHLYADRAYSSTLQLSERYQRLWSGEMPVEAEFTSDAISLDEFLSEHPEARPDFLKLDTQGTELHILRGSTRSLATIGMVEVEVELVEFYEDQPLFSDVVNFMAEQGFELLYLNRVFGSRRQVFQGPSRGQILFGDALFGKREEHLGEFTREQLSKFAILLCQYGHLDIAYQLVEAFPAVLEVVPRLRDVFGREPHRLKQVVSMQFDKLLALGLHLRRYNQRASDSDRSWPIR